MKKKHSNDTQDINIVVGAHACCFSYCAYELKFVCCIKLDYIYTVYI